ncbi:hypothetical protein [Amaricoccus sp.]|uniref:hypothetical protein n=1 Tax=Amaricoccus sp. TaxID=1872485 RepID=UPI001B422C00|nr:hypothetical protein [Amaricoccus sp.]MBP7242077.1 hypothetical protein [Amaricoccus sp.]
MKKSAATAMLLSLALAASSGPGFAKTKGKDVAAAIAIAAAAALGVAALAQDGSDYPPGKTFTTGQQKAEFEAGYRDGLAGARYRSNLPASTYGAGYDAGVRERKLQQGGQGGKKFAGVPQKAMKGCVEKAANNWKLRKSNVYATDARKGAAGTWLIEVVAGRRQGVCNMAADGTTKGKFIDGGSL